MTTTTLLTLSAASAAFVLGITIRRPAPVFASPADGLDALVASGQTPGAQYVHLDRDGVRLSHEAGLADVVTGEKVDATTVFAGYSTTKTLTAAAILELASRGAIDLDAPVSRYLPELAGREMPTVRQTLQHTGGWPNPVPVGWVHTVDTHATFNEDAFLRRVLAEYGTPKSPGRAFAYSNVGYLVLGEIVRRVSGQLFEAFVTGELIRPLGLGAPDFLGFVDAAPARSATGYVRRFSLLDVALGWWLRRDAYLMPASSTWTAFRPFVVDGAPYGGIFANARGFGRYLQAILRNEGPFTPELVATLATPGALVDGTPTPAAHGWYRGALDGEPFLHHAGGGGGFYCEIRVYPRLGRASAVMFNRSAMSDERVLDRLDRPVIAVARGDRGPVGR